MYLFNHLSIYLCSIYPSIYLSIYHSIYLTIDLSIHDSPFLPFSYYLPASPSPINTILFDVWWMPGLSILNLYSIHILNLDPLFPHPFLGTQQRYNHWIITSQTQGSNSNKRRKLGISYYQFISDVWFLCHSRAISALIKSNRAKAEGRSRVIY